MSATVGNKKIKHVLGACKEGQCVIRENFTSKSDQMKIVT